jgi:hypothetical protein
MHCQLQVEYLGKLGLYFTIYYIKFHVMTREMLKTNKLCVYCHL